MQRQMMTGLGLSVNESIARARTDLQSGVPVVLRQAEQAMLFAAIESLSPERLQVLRGLGPVTIALTARRAETLKLAAYDSDLVRVALPDDKGCDWLMGLADPATDLSNPMKGPLVGLRDGDPGLMRAALSLTKSARLLPAVVGVALAGPLPPDPALTEIDATELRTALAGSLHVHPVVTARVPTQSARDTRLHVFRSDDDGEEHYAIEIGHPDRSAPVLTRLHSACFTGDLMGSLKCDCGPQLRAAMAQMAEAGAGVLLYLNQEGRGIGLVNKMRAYSLQDQGFDTVEANHRLGFEDDERDFRIGASILRRMGISSVRLLTNNPAKIAMLQANGIAVSERVALHVGKTAENAAYLDTKHRKSGHLR